MCEEDLWNLGLYKHPLLTLNIQQTQVYRQGIEASSERTPCILKDPKRPKKKQTKEVR